MSRYASNLTARFLLVLMVLTATGYAARSASADDRLEINPSRVWLVEKARNGNILFRGNEPLTGRSVDDAQVPFEELLKLLKDRFEHQTNGAGTFPERFVFVDMSLINGEPDAELPYLYSEYQSFGGQTPLSGNQPFMKPGDTFPLSGYFELGPELRGRFLEVRCQLLWEPVAGISSPPDLTSTKEDAERIMHVQVPSYPNGQVAKPLFSVVDRLTEVMDETLDLPKVVYLHCMNGHDRSNEMATCYLLATHSQLSLSGAMDGTIENVNEFLNDLEQNETNPDSDIPYIQSLKPEPGHAVEWYYLYNRGSVTRVPREYQSDPKKWRD